MRHAPRMDRYWARGEARELQPEVFQVLGRPRLDTVAGDYASPLCSGHTVERHRGSHACRRRIRVHVVRWHTAGRLRMLRLLLVPVLLLAVLVVLMGVPMLELVMVCLLHGLTARWRPVQRVVQSQHGVHCMMGHWDSGGGADMTWAQVLGQLSNRLTASTSSQDGTQTEARQRGGQARRVVGW
jgi:hypothetical protein